MAQVVIWLIAFAVIFLLSYRRWEASVSRGLDRMMPAAMKTHGENRLAWCLALAILGATTLVRPVDILLMAIILALLVLIGWKLACWAMDKAASR